jgi:signal transduction histidine kinase
VLTVEDNGPGMPPEVRARCFDPYFTTKAAKSGTGLGLAVVRALTVDVLGGAIAVEESAWGGARFVVRLPAADAVTHAAPTLGTAQHVLTAGRPHLLPPHAP